MLSSMWTLQELVLWTLACFLTLPDLTQAQLDTVRFHSAEVRNHIQCQRLCATFPACRVSDFNYRTRTCSLYSEMMMAKATRTPQEPVLNHTSSDVCNGEPCMSGELCVLVESGLGFICLQGKQCPDPPRLDTKHSTASGALPWGQEVTYTCNHGYNQTGGDGWSVCQDNGRWSQSTLQCQLIDCGEPSVDSTMTLTQTTSYLFNSSVVFNCADGYRVATGDGVSVCLDTGRWSTPTLQCERVQCGDPPGLPNMTPGSITSQDSKLLVTYECNLGYRGTISSVWSAQSECLLSVGIWIPPSLTCEAIPNLISTGTSSSEATTLNCLTREVTPTNSPLGCDTGYVLVDCSAYKVDHDTEVRGGVEIVDMAGSAGCKLLSDRTRGSVRCCRGKDLECEYIYESSEVSCHKDFKLLGCSAHSDNKAIRGDWMQQIVDTCYGYLEDYGTVVSANAACCRAPGLSCTLWEDRDSGRTSVDCPDHLTLTGCTGYRRIGDRYYGNYIKDDGSSQTCESMADSWVEGLAMCCQIQG